MALFDFSPGQRLHGTYRLKRRIGEGGTGVVFEGVHLARAQPVAIKCLTLEGPRTVEAYDRWVADLELVSTLDHPHVVPVQDLNELDFTHPFVVLDLVQGRDLAATVEEAGRLTPHVVLDLVKQAGSALSRAHARGVIHGGLRPGNMLLVSHDAGHEVKLTDFGVHHLQRTEVAGVESYPIGTPPFMAPEQARGAGDQQDSTTDVHGLAALAYFALCGEPPLIARYLTRFMDRVCKEDPPPLSQRVEGYPEVLDRVLARALAREQQERYPTVGAFVLDLAAAVAMVKIDPNGHRDRPLSRPHRQEQGAPDPAPQLLAPRRPLEPPPARTDQVEEPGMRVTRMQEPPDDQQQRDSGHVERVTELLQSPAEEAAEAGVEPPRLKEVGDREDEDPTGFMGVGELAAGEREDRLRKTAVLGADGEVGFPSLRDVGQDTEEVPTIKRPMKPRDHDWSADFSSTIKDVGAEGLTPEAIMAMLGERGSPDDEEAP